MFRPPIKLTAAIAFALSGIPTASFAGAPAFAGIAAEADSAETAASNPAGMARLGESAAAVQLMAAHSSGKFEVDEGRTTIDGGDPDNDKAPVVIPFGYYVKQLDERWHVGISLTVPNGFGADYGSDWAGRYYSDSYSLVYVMLAPAVSYRVDDQWSLGASLGINYVASESEVAFNNLSPGMGDGRIKADVNGVGFSLTLSALYELDKQTRIGLVYTSQSVTDLEGDLKFRNLGPVVQSALQRADKLDSDIEVTNRLPQRIVAGIYHQMDSGNYYTADVAWMEFSKFGTTNVAWDGTDLRFDDDGTYNDIWALTLGAGFPMGKYTWKAGVFYLSPPVDDDKRTLAMALDRVIGIGGGVSFPLEGTRSVDINLNLLDLGKAPVDTGASAVRGRVVGETNNPYVVMFDASYHF
ncbi:MAG TPA: outer membrane protein transport protein [Spongiibacteraceae bacterium]|nr:outer membrane protein transport protein [Spongiibacteraceae bacterium]